MKKLLLVLAFLPVLANAQVKNLPLTGLQTPESVKINNEKLYVSNLGNPDAPADGFIIKADTDGKNQKTLLKGQLDSPKGFAFLTGGIVLIADQVNSGKTAGNLVLADLDNDKIIAKTTVADSKFLNDVAYIGGNKFMVTDTGAGKIYEVTVNEGAKSVSYKLFNDKTVGPNGIVFDEDGQRLFVAGSTFGGDAKGGQVYKIDLKTKEMKNILKIDQLGTGALDGIYYDDNFGTLYVSDWGKGDGNSVIFELNPIPYGSYIVTETYKPGFTDVADFDIYKDVIYAPEFTKNKVSTVALGESLVAKSAKEAKEKGIAAPAIPEVDTARKDGFGAGKWPKILLAAFALVGVIIAAGKMTK